MPPVSQEQLEGTRAPGVTSAQKGLKAVLGLTAEGAALHVIPQVSTFYTLVFWSSGKVHSLGQGQRATWGWFCQGVAARPSGHDSLPGRFSVLGCPAWLSYPEPATWQGPGVRSIAHGPHQALGSRNCSPFAGEETGTRGGGRSAMDFSLMSHTATASPFSSETQLTETK